jgi:uncharacterized protein
MPIPMNWKALVLGALAAWSATAAWATDGHCRDDDRPAITFVQFPSPNIDPQTAPTQPMLTIKAKLSIPRACGRGSQRVPAVVIAHGSGGVDGLGDFYESALNEAGIATLQINMWEARGVTGVANRPRAPILTYPDAFSALGFLAAHPRIVPTRIGILGFSWGAAISLGSAEKLYAGMFGGGRQFKAHVANYPPCYAANNTTIPVLNPPSQTGTQFLNLTGAPVMIQIGSKDDYDNGTEHCKALARTVNPLNHNAVQVVEVEGAYHGWDRLTVPFTTADPFANEGSYFRTGSLPPVRFVPDVESAYDSRERVARFFKRKL